MLILSNDKAQRENKAETLIGKYTAKCLPDPAQASTFAVLWFGGAVYRSSLLKDFSFKCQLLW